MSPKIALFCAFPTVVTPVGGDWFIAFNSSSKAVPLPGLAARVLLSCKGCMSLGEHIDRIVSDGLIADRIAATTQLHLLVRLGLFVIANRPAPPTEAACDSAPAVASIAIVTADRPMTLRRCLESVIGHVRAHGHRPRVFVVDGSRFLQHETEEAVRQVEASRGFALTYFGPREEHRLHLGLAAHGIPPQLLRLGLSIGNIGSNRNVALLLTAGEACLMVDDDILLNPWVTDSRRRSITVGGHVDRRRWQFFSTRAQALATEEQAVDVLGAHAAVLGRSLAQLQAWATEIDISDACAHLLPALRGEAEATVRVSMSGIAGDSARYCHGRLLFQAGPLRDMLSQDPDLLGVALASREVRILANRLTLMHDGSCASYCMGIANSGILPPFMPANRGEDSVFGAMVSRMDPRTLFAHLPVGVWHDSIRPSSLGIDVMRSARETTLSDLLLSVTANADLTHASSVESRLDALGRSVRELAHLPPGEFAHLNAQTALQIRSAQLIAAESFVSRQGSGRGLYGSAIDRYRAILLKHCQQQAFAVPADFAEGERSTRLQLAQASLDTFGELLTAWPAVLDASASVRYDFARRPDGA